MSKFDYKTTTSTKFLFSFFPSRSLFLTIQEKKNYSWQTQERRTKLHNYKQSI